MSSRDPSLNSKNLLNVLVEVTDWDQLAPRLSIKDHKINEIERNKHGNVAQCKLALVDLWLRSDLSASWNKLVEALTEMGGHERVIDKIKTEFLPGVPVGEGRAKRPAVSQPVPHGATPRLAYDSNRSASHPGVRQPVTVPEGNPEDEIRHAQRMIDAQDEDGPEDKLIKLMNSFATWNFNVDTQDLESTSRNTLMHHACLRGDLSSLKALVAFGANVSLCNNFNQTPLDIANMMGKDDLIKFLKKVGGLEGKALNSVNNPPKHPIQEQHERMEDDGEDQMRGEMGLAEGHLILTLDYSSTMALVQLEVLNQLEKATGKRIVDMFEWIVASGVSGFLMMAMIYAKKSVSDLRRIYFRLRDRVFSGQEPEERGRELESFAREVFGDTKRMIDMMDPEDPKLLIGAVNKSSTRLNPIFFNNYYGDQSTVHLWKVARYTCSSPLYVGESDNFVDGGALYKNPSVFAFAIIREHYQLQSLPITGVVSLGDGLMPAMELGKLVKDNYYSHFIPSTANTLSEELSKSFSGICSAGGLEYDRIDPLLDEYIAVPEEARLEQLINAVIRTIIQCQDVESSAHNFIKKFNNNAGQ